jgi:hypothetical protein
MQYAYAYQLNGSQVSGLDPSAKAYINAVVAAGATVSGTQRTAINGFYKTAKAGGWYSSLKRMYLPIWGVASPNAICMTSLTSGTFVGGVTQGAGFVLSDGSTGYFDTASRFDTLGFTVETGYQFGLIYSGTLVSLAQIQGSGVAVSNKQTVLGQAVSLGRARFRHSGSGTGSIEAVATVNGIISGSRTVGNRSLYKRGSTRSVLISTSGGDSGTIPESNVYALAYNNSDSVGGSNPSAFSNVQLGSYGFGLGLTDSQDSAFTLALKTLWETCTGLTLP